MNKKQYDKLVFEETSKLESIFEKYSLSDIEKRQIASLFLTRLEEGLEVTDEYLESFLKKKYSNRLVKKAIIKEIGDFIK